MRERDSNMCIYVCISYNSSNVGFSEIIRFK